VNNEELKKYINELKKEYDLNKEKINLIKNKINILKLNNIEMKCERTVTLAITSYFL